MKIQIDSIIIPFVGTLNDSDMAIPVFTIDADNRLCASLAETPAIQTRKERARQYLRYLPAQYLDKERLFLFAIFITCDKRTIDATNILDPIQNAGNRILWNDDSQFSEVHCHRHIESMLPEMERIVVYVGKTPSNLDNDFYGKSISNEIIDHYLQNYDMKRSLEEHFNTEEVQRVYQEGFWQDNRFLKVIALKTNYQQWLIKKLGEQNNK